MEAKRLVDKIKLSEEDDNDVKSCVAQKLIVKFGQIKYFDLKKPVNLMR